jgi:hypothetical protein
VIAPDFHATFIFKSNGTLEQHPIPLLSPQIQEIILSRKSKIDIRKFAKGFRRYPKVSERFPKLSERSPKTGEPRNVSGGLRADDVHSLL